MVYKNFKKGRRFSKKGSNSSNSDKRNNRRNTDGKDSRYGKLDKSKERCFNCDEIGHFAADCRKPRAEKKQDLISRKRNWDDSSDSDDGVNYALMEKNDVEANNAELKNNGIKSENSVLKKMNDYLEIELLSMLEIQKERDKEILENGCWGSGFGYSARSNSDKKSGKETERIEPIKTDSKVKLNKVQIKTSKFNPSANTVKSIHEEGTTSASRSNLITDKSEQVHTKSVNIGSMTQKQLKQKVKGDRRNALFLDSGCSGHMTGYKSLISEFEEKAGPNISYGDGKLGKILGYGKIKIGNVIIENVALVA
ncbi:hypothetical protein AgCh_009070 [Apium graveolens]